MPIWNQNSGASNLTQSNLVLENYAVDDVGESRILGSVGDASRTPNFDFRSVTYDGGADANIDARFFGPNLTATSSLYVGGFDSIYSGLFLSAQDHNFGNTAQIFADCLTNGDGTGLCAITLKDNVTNAKLNFYTPIAEFTFRPFDGSPDNGTLKINGLDEVGAAAATFTANNAPAAISPQKWLRIDIGGVVGYIPWFSV